MSNPSDLTPAVLQTLDLHDMRIRYLEHPDGCVSMELLPQSCLTKVVDPLPNIGATGDAAQVPRFLDVPLRRPEPLVQLRRAGDEHGKGSNPGRTLRYSATTSGLKVRDARTESGAEGVSSVIELATEDGLVAEHHLVWQPGWQAVRVWTEGVNRGEALCTLELCTSFSLGGLTPFCADDAPGRLFIHRFRSGWSSEDRHERVSAEALGLERAWAPFNLMIERFGQVGTKPVLGFSPWLGVEDAEAGVFWAAQPEAPCSWQCEIGRFDDGLSMAGGPADREFGHWRKRLNPGDRFATEPAWLTVCQGDFDETCARLIHQQGADKPAPGEEDLPVLFNEWCTTWGTPSHENLVEIADRLQDSGCRYLVIDAGWYKPATGGWGSAQGDWEPSLDLFPQGLEAACDDIRARGLIPGLWFEFEVAGQDSQIVRETDRLLHLDGDVINASGRRFLDMRQERNHAYLEERVIDRMERCGIGYIKVDYNATVGIGCDGAESPGEGLRQHADGVRRFFQRMRERLPGLVIENCSSGGQRAEAGFGRIADMHSFSDAHTCRDIPVVAANIARRIPARQNQVWAVLMPEEDRRRLVYSLAATFVGRMCLSGEIWKLNEDQMAVAHQAIALYQTCVPTLRDGTLRRYGDWSPSRRHLTGWQAVTLTAEDHTVIVVHVFGDGAAPDAVPVPGRHVIDASLTSDATEADLSGEKLTVEGMPPWSAAVFLLS